MKSDKDKGWEEHCKVCGTCKKIGKYNNKGGTTESYHAFVTGFIMGTLK